MRKRIGTLLALLFCILAAGGCGKEEKSEKPLVVAMELAYPPFEGRNDAGEPEGVSVDLMKAFGEYAGREIRIENTAWDGLIPSLQTGKADLVGKNRWILRILMRMPCWRFWSAKVQRLSLWKT